MSREWRIRVRGAVSPSTAQGLDGLVVTDVGTTTLMQGAAGSNASCSETLAELQALGLEVVEVLWVDQGADQGPDSTDLGSDPDGEAAPGG